MASALFSPIPCNPAFYIANIVDCMNIQPSLFQLIPLGCLNALPSTVVVHLSFSLKCGKLGFCMLHLKFISPFILSIAFLTSSLAALILFLIVFYILSNTVLTLL